MQKSLMTTAIAAAFAWTLTGPVLAQVAAVNGAGVSTMSSSIVKIERHTRNENDPLTKYGAGFYLVVFNKSGQPIPFGPDSVVIKDRRGNVLSQLTDERIAEIKQDEANSAQLFNTFLGIGLGALGGVAAAHAPNPVAADTIAVDSTIVGSALINNGQDQAAKISSEGDVLTAAYQVNPLVAGSVDPLTAVSGRVLVEKLKDNDPAKIFVTVGDDSHEIDFN